MTARSAAAATALALLCSSLVLGACSAEKAPVVHTVTIDATSYTPKDLVVDAGDTIVWSNRDVLVHTVTSEAGGFDSMDIAPGTTWKLTPTRKGAFAFLCSYHPLMQGMLRVR